MYTTQNTMGGLLVYRGVLGAQVGRRGVRHAGGPNRCPNGTASNVIGTSNIQNTWSGLLQHHCAHSIAAARNKQELHHTCYTLSLGRSHSSPTDPRPIGYAMAGLCTPNISSPLLSVGWGGPGDGCWAGTGGLGTDVWSEVRGGVLVVRVVRTSKSEAASGWRAVNGVERDVLQCERRYGGFGIVVTACVGGVKPVPTRRQNRSPCRARAGAQSVRDTVCSVGVEYKNTRSRGEQAQQHTARQMTHSATRLRCCARTYTNSR